MSTIRAHRVGVLTGTGRRARWRSGRFSGIVQHELALPAVDLDGHAEGMPADAHGKSASTESVKLSPAGMSTLRTAAQREESGRG